MAYNEELAHRVRGLIGERKGFSERKMFGGMCFMLGGHMCCGVIGDDLMVRVGSDAHAAALKEPHARAMDFTGRPMKGMVYVGPGGTEEDDGLAAWVQRGVDFAGSLPPKKR